MDTPKPGPFVPKNPATPKNETPVVKKPFVPKPHLTERPFQNNEALRELAKQNHPSNKPTRAGRRNARNSK